MRGGLPHSLFLIAVLALPGAAQAATVTLHPVVAELFTSQACVSCLPADMLMKQMAAARPELLVLSYHIDYWDSAGWKDPFSAQANTERQRHYRTQLYTPELIVNGTVSMIGSDENKVAATLATQRIDESVFNLEIMREGKGKQLAALVNTNGAAPAPARVEVWEIIYTPYTRSVIRGGKNEGRIVENVDNVRVVRLLGALDGKGAGHFLLQEPASPKDGIAVIVQPAEQGPILAAVSYRP